MEAKSILGGFFKNTSFRIFFWDLVALSPAKVKKFMANWESSYGADLLQDVVKSGYCNGLNASIGSTIYFLSAKIASKLLLSLNLFGRKGFKR
jgi:hypothetical protein